MANIEISALPPKNVINPNDLYHIKDGSNSGDFRSTPSVVKDSVFSLAIADDVTFGSLTVGDLTSTGTITFSNVDVGNLTSTGSITINNSGGDDSLFLNDANSYVRHNNTTSNVEVNAATGESVVLSISGAAVVTTSAGSVDLTGTLQTSDNVGIGTSVSPSLALNVLNPDSTTVAALQSSAGNASFLQFSGSTNQAFVGVNEGDLVFQTAANSFGNALTIDATTGNLEANNRVIIGTDSGAAARLTSQGSGTTNATFSARFTNSANTVTHSFDDAGNAYHLGAVGIGGVTPVASALFTIPNRDALNEIVFSGTETTNVLSATTGLFQFGTNGVGGDLSIVTGAGVEAVNIDSNQKVGIGAAALGTSRLTVQDSTTTDHILRVGTSVEGGFVRSGAGSQTYAITWNAAQAAMYIGGDTITNRSLNLSNTVNANGADYAEYKLKSPELISEGVDIQKGDLVGFNSEGKITNKWSESIKFAIKSTNPNLVGGDTWATTPRPDLIVPEKVKYTGINEPEESLENYEQLLSQYEQDQEDYLKAIDEESKKVEALNTKAIEEWDVIHQAERATVDRIAFCGIVPLNGDVECKAGDYIIPMEGEDDRIVWIALDKDAEDECTTLKQLKDHIKMQKRTVGQVDSIGEDGRPLINVRM